MTRALQIVLALSPLALAARQASVPTWCGKPYKASSPHITIPPESKFAAPPTTTDSLLNFQCNPAIKPYVAGEDSSGTVVIDAEVVHDIGTKYDAAASGNSFSVSISVSGVGTVVSNAPMGLTATGTPLSFSLGKLSPSSTPYTVTCTATFGSSGATYTSTTKLSYLPPNPYGGNTVKMDLTTGGLLVKGPSDATYKPFFPFGFYTQFDDYLSNNNSVLTNAAAAG